MSEPSFEECAKQLDELGIDYTVETEYRPKDPPRTAQPLRLFQSVLPPLSAEDWCSMTMRDGDAYVGGCCGTLSALQDSLNETFRNGPWVSVEDLAIVAAYWINHGDYPDGWGDSEDLPTLVTLAKKEGADPWLKLALCWQLVRRHYAPKKPRASAKGTPLQQALQVLSRSIEFFDLLHLFSCIETPEEQSEVLKTRALQRQGTSLIMLARLLPALKVLNDHIQELDPGPLEGLALIDRKAESESQDISQAIAHNGLGYCIYASQEEADKVLDLWKKQQAEYEVEEREDIEACYRLQAVRVSAQKGVEIL